MISPEAELLSRLDRTIRDQHLFQTGDTIIVAISGGADSTALLDLLSRLSGYGLGLIAAHLNHCLRGSDSDADEDFCRLLAERYGITFESRRLDVGEFANSMRLNLEDAGRQARIVFLDELRRKHGAAAVALAHHADDQAETVLMRLLRGSGMTGLSGMKYRNSRGYVRPLLKITRSEIEQYLACRGLNWREDASNLDTSYLRNRIRHELLPILERYNPAIRSSLAATASILGADDAVLDDLSKIKFDQACRTEGGDVVCGIAQIRALNQSLRRRVLRHALKHLSGSLHGLGLRHIDDVCTLIDSERPNASLTLPEGISVVCEYERLVFRHASEADPDTDQELLITEPGCFQISKSDTIKVEIIKTGILPKDSDTLYVDLNKTPLPWQIRTFRPGDRMIPFGMNGRKKVKDIFIDKKIPLYERRRLPLLFCEGQLLWVIGLCFSELCRVDYNSDAIAKVTYKRS